MADRFGDIARQVRLHCPLAGAFLVRLWVQNAYRSICDRGEWSWLRAENEFLISASRSGTVTVVRNSATVTGVTLVFAATDIGRQFRTTGLPYTIASVDVGTNTAILDRVWGLDSAVATTATILDAYVTLPADFQRFIGVIDPQNNWRLHHWLTEDELNSWDAGRTSTGTPWALFSRRLASVPAATIGCAQYELWPYQLSQAHYPYFYFRTAETLTEDSDVRGLGDLLLTGALAEAAAWPGLEDRKNPYFNLVLAKAKQDEFNRGMAQQEVRDQEVYPTWWETISWINHVGWAPIDARFAQSHDV